MYKSTSIIFVLGTIFFIAPLCAATKDFNHSHSSLQDSLWKKYEDVNALNSRLYDKRDQLTKEEYLILHESYLRKMRTQGVKIWNSRPNDKNRYSWLEFTIWVNVPCYYNFALNRFDTDEKTAWDKLYPLMKTEYMNYLDTEFPKEVRLLKKFGFEREELAGDIIYHKSIFQATGKKIDLLAYSALLIKLIKKAPSKNSFLATLQDTAEQVLMNPDDYGVNDDDIVAFLKALKAADIPDLSEWAEGKNQMFRLKEEPLQLSFKSVDGELVDINKMKGKIILIDFWATWCGSCLDYMPTIKNVYNKYHDKGLEVISISINKLAEKEQVLAEEKKMGVSWPLGIIGDNKLRNDIWKRFAFTSVPQLILLDKKGILIENNGKLMDERTLNELLKNILE